MALSPLATLTDLLTRGVDPSDPDRALAALDSASEAVRDAAGSPIVATTATISLPAPSPCDQWLDLPGPVSAVALVEVDGEAFTDYVRQGSSLWARGGWRTTWEPVNVDVQPRSRASRIWMCVSRAQALGASLRFALWPRWGFESI